MSTSNPKTLADLRSDFFDRVGIADNTANQALALKYLNFALQDMHIEQANRFPWAERRGVIITHAPYSTGTISIAAATRTTVTGSSTLWNTAVTGMGFNNARAGGKIKPSGINEILEVSSVSSDTAITVTSRYTGDALTDSSYTYFEDEYALAADFAKFVDIRMFSTDLDIPLIGRREFRAWYPRNDVAGQPKVATYFVRPYSGSTSIRHTVAFHPYPNDEYQIPYWYVTNYLAVTSAGVEQERFENTTDEPIIPPQYRHVLPIYATYHYYRDKKDDVRSQETKAEYVDLVIRICGDGGPGDSRPRLVANGPRAWRSQRFDVGNRFDQIRDRYGRY